MTRDDDLPPIESLRSAFAGRLHTEPADTAPFLLDYRRRWQGTALAVAQPDSTEDVARVVRWCRAHRYARSSPSPGP